MRALLVNHDLGCAVGVKCQARSIQMVCHGDRRLTPRDAPLQFVDPKRQLRRLGLMLAIAPNDVLAVCKWEHLSGENIDKHRFATSRKECHIEYAKKKKKKKIQQEQKQRSLKL